MLCPPRLRGASQIPDGAVESHVSQKRRDMGHPAVVVASANSRFLTGLSARFGMTRVRGRGRLSQRWKRCATPNPREHAARLKSRLSRSCRFPNPEKDEAVESHASQGARRMGHPWFVVASV